MELRRLGETDIEISPIGMGTIQFSQGKGFVGKAYRPLAQETVNDVIAAALRSGINWFDTAEKYGNGKSEDALSRALSHANVNEKDVLVATKWYPVFRSAKHLQTSVPQRMRSLNGMGIGLYQTHLPGGSLSSITQQMRVMAELVHTQQVQAVGVSNYSATQMEEAHDVLRAHGVMLASNQVKVNLLNRTIESNGVLEVARRLKVTLIAHSPLAGGILTGKFHKDRNRLNSIPILRRTLGGFSERRIEASAPLIDELQRIAGRHAASVTQIALNWLIRYYGETVVTIPGATTPEQAEANAASMDIHLSGDEIKSIADASQSFT